MVCSLFNYCFNLINALSTDAPSDLCSAKNCSNAAGCTVDNDGAAICFCNSGYDLLANGSCISKFYMVYSLLCSPP